MFLQSLDLRVYLMKCIVFYAIVATWINIQLHKGTHTVDADHAASLGAPGEMGTRQG